MTELTKILGHLQTPQISLLTAFVQHVGRINDKKTQHKTCNAISFKNTATFCKHNYKSALPTTKYVCTKCEHNVNKQTKTKQEH